MLSYPARFRKYVRSHPLFRRIVFSFYFRLIVLDLKKNHFLMVLWLILFAMVTNQVASRYGLAYIFLGPEYFDQINFLSYFLTGFACGGFIMAYNISSFVKNAFRFPFLATLRNPFTKYCLNNFILPLMFIGVYGYDIADFLRHEELMGWGRIAWMLTAFVLGIAFFIFSVLTYFFKTNKNITKLYGIRSSETFANEAKPARSNGERNPYLVKESRDWYVETYLVMPFKMRRVRSVRHYKKEILNSVLKQNHRSAFIFQLIAIASLLAFGLVSSTSIFIVPTSVSIFLLFTVVIMIFSSLYTWFRGWTTIIFILFLLTLNYLHKVNFLTTENRAYGLNYKGKTAVYDYGNLNRLDESDNDLKDDIRATLGILNKWKEKNRCADSTKKPKLVLINTSGGGLRASLWTLYALQYADSLLEGRLLKQTQLITGSSGGMIGAAYLRELYLRKQHNEISSYYSGIYRTNISKDILNPIAFTIVTNEWAFPLKYFTVDDQEYPQDRGYAFEQTLEKNVDHVFEKRLSDYYLPEANSEVPMMVFSSTIVNDGRKLLISPQGISYLTQNSKTKHIEYHPLIDAIEYSRFLKDQGAGKTLYSSVLRMSATFPYIMPVVSLPSEPRVEMIDAGMRDNYGLETSLNFIKTFNDWIADNTSGVVIIQLRDKHKYIAIDENPPQTLVQTLNRPMGSFYGNLFQVQDYNQNQRIQVTDLWCKAPVEVIDLQLRNEDKSRISLSWHLTNNEKQKVIASINLRENQKAISRIRELLK